MAYTDAGNAAFRCTGFAQGGSEYLGKIRTSFEKVVSREVIQTDAINTPEARPVDNLDLRATIEFLDWTSNLPETSEAAEVTITFSEANGTTGSTVGLGNLVVSGYRAGIQRRNGGNPMAQDFELEGSEIAVETFSM